MSYYTHYRVRAEGAGSDVIYGSELAAAWLTRRLGIPDLFNPIGWSVRNAQIDHDTLHGLRIIATGMPTATLTLLYVSDEGLADGKPWGETPIEPLRGP